MTTRYPKRLIEVDLPIARISAHARREKSIRHGHISTLHIWWARRPLAACRAVTCAALWPDPADERCPPAFREAAAELLMAFARRVFPQKITEEGRQLQSEKHLSVESRGRWEGLLKAEQDGCPLDPVDPAHQDVVRGALLDFIADFANWDNSTVPAYLETSRALTGVAHQSLSDPGYLLPPWPAGPRTDDTCRAWLSTLNSQLSTLPRPLVVDPFAGGGSIPLEALRVGADAFASDLNPVAVLLNKVVLEYIPKYGQRLADEVRKWGQWVKEQAEQELAEFYPKDPDGATPIAYLWARTITCEGPNCGAVFPLVRSFWIATGGKRSTALRLRLDSASKQFSFDLVEKAKAKDASEGTIQRGAATCPFCSYTMPVRRVREQAKERGLGEVMSVKLVRTDDGTEFRYPTQLDQRAIDKTTMLAEKLRHATSGELTVIPNEKVSVKPHSVNRLPMYGLESWGDAFGDRQLVMLNAYVTAVRAVRKEIEGDRDLATAVATCLSLSVSKLANYYSSLCVWRVARSCVAQVFGRQALPMTWDYGEMCPFAGSAGDWSETLSYLGLLIDHITDSASTSGQVVQADAGHAVLPDDASDLFCTDPPYYDAVSYADLSDYCYVWLRRMLAEEHPQLLSFDQTDKLNELIVEPSPAVGPKKTRDFYEGGMGKAFLVGRRVCKPSGAGLVVFAHRSTTAWESLLQSMIDSGWHITASWPIDTERPGKLAGNGQARLMSSIHLMCRPRETEDGSLREAVGEWRDVLSELPQRIHEWMPRLAAEGVVGADAIFACLGPALEIFSRYSRVEKASGEAVPLREYLEQVWAAVSTEALSMIFRDADAAGLEPDARLTAMWLWTLGGGSSGPSPQPAAQKGEGADDDSDADDDDDAPAKSKGSSGGYTLEFDAARKIAQGLGIHLEQSESIVEVKGDKATLLPVSDRTRHLFGKDEASATTARGKKKKAVKQRSLFEELDALEAEAEEQQTVAGELKPTAGETVLDRVHQSMILFASGRGEALRRFLVEDGAGKDARFWKLAQSLSALYPTGTEEKRWVDGVLARKKGLGL